MASLRKQIPSKKALMIFTIGIAVGMTPITTDRSDQDAALRDAIRETAGCADELAFWKFQAIYHRALMLHGRSMPGQVLMLEGSRVWREAEKQLEEHRADENRTRVSHAEGPRDPGGT